MLRAGSSHESSQGAEAARDLGGLMTDRQPVTITAPVDELIRGDGLTATFTLHRVSRVMCVFQDRDFDELTEGPDFLTAASPTLPHYTVITFRRKPDQNERFVVVGAPHPWVRAASPEERLPQLAQQLAQVDAGNLAKSVVEAELGFGPKPVEPPTIGHRRIVVD
jgi:hypothetical protein